MLNKKANSLLLSSLLIFSILSVVSYTFAQEGDAPAATEPAPSEEVTTTEASSEEVTTTEAPAEEVPSEPAPEEQPPTEEAPSEPAPEEQPPSEEQFKGQECSGSSVEYCADANSCASAGGNWCNDVFCSPAPCDSIKVEYELPEECKGISPEECAQKFQQQGNAPSQCEGLSQEECEKVLRDLHTTSDEGKYLPPECTGYSPEECKNVLEEKYGNDFSGQVPPECEGVSPEECKAVLDTKYGENFVDEKPAECGDLGPEECKALMTEKYGNNFAGTMPDECKGFPPQDCMKIMQEKYGDNFEGAPNEDYRPEGAGERRRGFPTEIPPEIVEAGAEQQFIDMMCINMRAHMGQFLGVTDIIVEYFDSLKSDPVLSFLDIDTSKVSGLKTRVENGFDAICSATPENFQVKILVIQGAIEGDDGMEGIMKGLSTQIQTQIQAKMTELFQDPMNNRASLESIGAKMEDFGTGLKSKIDEGMEKSALSAEEKQEIAEKEYAMFLQVMNFHLDKVKERRIELVAEGVNTTAIDTAIAWMEGKLVEGEAVFKPDVDEAEKDAFIESLMEGFETVKRKAEKEVNKQTAETIIARAKSNLARIEKGAELAEEEGLDVGLIEAQKRKIEFFLAKAESAMQAEDYEEAMKNLRLAKAEFNKVKKLWNELNEVYKAKRATK